MPAPLIPFVGQLFITWLIDKGFDVLAKALIDAFLGKPKPKPFPWGGVSLVVTIFSVGGFAALKLYQAYLEDTKKAQVAQNAQNAQKTHTTQNNQDTHKTHDTQIV